MTRYLHIEVVMSGIVGMQDKLLNQVTCRVKQDILEKTKHSLMLLLCHMFDQTSLLQLYRWQTVGQVHADRGRTTRPQPAIIVTSQLVTEI